MPNDSKPMEKQEPEKASKSAPTAKAKGDYVTLIASHHHAGKTYEAGSVIAVNARQKAFLIQHRKIVG